MIVTVTPNPAIDRTVRVAALRPGEVHRTSAASSEAAGKGLNVARALHLHGIETLAVLPVAANSRDEYVGLLDGAVPIAPVAVPGTVRTNLTIVEADGTVTKLNEPGPPITAADVDRLLAAVDAIDAGWIVGCGSLPPGAPSDFYGRLARLASPERRVAVDTSGEPLRAAVSTGVALIKPNLDELAELASAPLENLGDVVDAARSLVEGGIGAVLVSLGAEGAVYVDKSTVVYAEPAVERVSNTVGAGDALLAGYLAAGGGPAAVASAMAWSIAAVRAHGTGMSPVRDADRAALRVHPRIDRSRPLCAREVSAR